MLSRGNTQKTVPQKSQLPLSLSLPFYCFFFCCSSISAFFLSRVGGAPCAHPLREAQGVRRRERVLQQGRNAFRPAARGVVQTQVHVHQRLRFVHLFFFIKKTPPRAHTRTYKQPPPHRTPNNPRFRYPNPIQARSATAGFNAVRKS